MIQSVVANPRGRCSSPTVSPEWVLVGERLRARTASKAFHGSDMMRLWVSGSMVLSI
jgi:hypothetical protein